MTRYTDRWGFSILGPGDALQADGYKFSDADRRLIDRLLTFALENHHHSGAAGTDRTPVSGPNLTVANTGGAITSGVRFYYAFTIIDVDGNESGPSPSAYADAPAGVGVPPAPALSFTAGSGSLGPGSYSYVLSAYKGATSLETKATNSAFVTITGANPSNEVSVILPARPPGADGFNIYRKSPTGLHYLYLTSVAGSAPLDVWIDNGSISGDCDRSLPSTNTTTNTNAVTVTFPGATPTIPDGFSWRLYRTSDPSNWGRSYLATIGPSGSPPSTALTFVDVGTGTQMGGPPSRAQLIGSPPKVLLTNAAEVTGTLPPGLNVIPTVISFAKAGGLAVETGSFVWVCDYEQADIIACRAFLGRDSSPASSDVIVDVNIYRPDAATPAWTSIYDNGSTRPRVPVGAMIGERSAPILHHLVRGDLVSVDIDQVGGGATPTDYDLTVNVFMMVQAGSTTVSQVWT